MDLTKTNTIGSLRNRLLNDALLWVAIVSLPVLIMSVSRAMTMGWRPLFLIQILFVGALWAAWLVRKNLTFNVRSGILLAALAATGLVGFMHIGLVSAGGPLLVLFQFTAVLLLNGVATLRAIGIVTFSLLGVAIAASTGVLNFDLDYSKFVHDPKNWAIMIYVIVCHGGVVAFLGWRLLQELSAQQQALQDANLQLSQRSAEAEAANRIKGEILGSLSHEFRTPLNGIFGMADLLEITETDESRRPWLDGLKESAKHLGGMLDRMLDFVNLTTDAVKLSTGPFAFHELLQNVVRSFRPRAETKGLALSLNIAADVPLAVSTDGQRLQQLLVELLDNAIRFTEDGFVTLDVSMAAQATGETRPLVCFAVVDSGPGIPTAEQEHIFDSFYQIDGSATRAAGGNGLGLAISRRIAQVLGGDIAVVSTGTGSRFTVTIPVDLAGAEDLQ